jgi:AbiV family abortive infection protein
MTRSSSRAFFRNAWKKSIENAKQLLEDAKLLLCNRSYGHAIALAIFSDEEVAKAFTCWLVAKGFIPEDSRAVEHAFTSHASKHSAQLAIFEGLLLRSELQQGKITPLKVIKRGMRVTEKQIKRAEERHWQIADEREFLRQDAIYTNIEDRELLSPSRFTNDYAKEIILGVEQRLDFETKLMTDPSREVLRSFRALFDSLPKQAIMEDAIPPEWFRTWKKKGLL